MTIAEPVSNDTQHPGGIRHNWPDEKIEAVAKDVLTGASYNIVAQRHDATIKQIERAYKKWLKRHDEMERLGLNIVAQGLNQRLWQIANDARLLFLEERRTNQPDNRLLTDSLKLESDTLMKIARLKGLDKIIVSGQVDLTISNVQTKIQTLENRRHELEAQRQLDNQIVDAELVE